MALRERNLKKWDPGNDSLTFGGLEDSNHLGWDQFEENQRLFGVTSNYDENIYTTVIDKTDPLYKQRAAAAEKIAKEIESSAAITAHVAEERGHNSGASFGEDEEEKLVSSSPGVKPILIIITVTVGSNDSTLV